MYPNVVRLKWSAVYYPAFSFSLKISQNSLKPIKSRNFNWIVLPRDSDWKEKWRLNLTPIIAYMAQNYIGMGRFGRIWEPILILHLGGNISKTYKWYFLALFLELPILRNIHHKKITSLPIKNNWKCVSDQNAIFGVLKNSEWRIFWDKNLGYFAYISFLNII